MNADNEKTDAEKYLNQLYKLDQIIKSDQEELERLRSLAESISNDISQERVQSSNSNDKTAEIISKIVDLENEIKQEMNNFIDLKKEIRDVINQVDDADLKIFLRYRYILFYSWKMCIDKLNCSNTQVQRIKRKAIEAVDEILKSRN